MICNTILDAIGNTPIIRLQHLPEEDSAEILVKFEGLNVGGSIPEVSMEILIIAVTIARIEPIMVVIRLLKIRRLSGQNT